MSTDINPNRDVDRLIEKSTQNKRRINLSVKRSRSTLAKSYELQENDIKDAEDYWRNRNQNASVMEAVKSKLGQIASSSNGHARSSTEASMGKETPQSSAFSSEYNSLQSLSVKSNERKKNSEWQPEPGKVEQQGSVKSSGG